MDIVFDRCAGLDVHKRTVVACRLTRDAQGARVAQTQTFGTTTSELLRLSDWLAEGGCTHVGLESTGCFGNRSSICSKPPSRSGCGCTHLIRKTKNVMPGRAT
jgi:hypothetical protein